LLLNIKVIWLVVLGATCGLYAVVFSVWRDLVLIDACYDLARTFNHDAWRCEGAAGEAMPLAQVPLTAWQQLKLFGFPLCMSLPVGVLLRLALKRFAA
jgi:hypothetical protein